MHLKNILESAKYSILKESPKKVSLFFVCVDIENQPLSVCVDAFSPSQHFSVMLGQFPAFLG